MRAIKLAGFTPHTINEFTNVSVAAEDNTFLIFGKSSSVAPLVFALIVSGFMMRMI